VKNRESNRLNASLLSMVAGSVLALSAAAQAQVNYTWASGVPGIWNDTTKWAPVGFPGALDTAIINTPGAYTVTIPNNTSQQAAALSIGNPGATLFLPDNTTLTLNGPSHTNAGLIQVSGPGQPGNTNRIIFSGASTISGGGAISLQAAGAGDNDTALLQGPGILTNASNHTIGGKGRIYGGLNNAGLVNADQAGGILRLLSDPKANSGTMRATNGGSLYINAALSQSPTGLLEAQNGSAVLLISTSVSGGTFASSGTGAVINANNQTSSIDGVTLTPGSLLQLNDNSTLNVGAAGLTNNGLVTVQNIGAPGNPVRLNAAAATTNLLGTGTIRLQSTSTGTDDTSLLGYTVAANRFIVGPSLTIDGKGRIYTLLTNNGTIDANVSAKTLQLLDQPKANAGMMRASAGGQLLITNSSVTQTGPGQLLADGGTVTLQGAAISGGPMSSINGGLLLNTNNQTSSIDSMTLTQGTLQLNDNTNLLVRNSLTNNGLVTVQNIGAPGNPARFTVDTPSVTLSGNGTVRLQATSNFSDTANLGSTAAANLLTHAATHTIAGNGRIYTALTNNGTILANESAANRQVLQLLGEPKTNNNIFRATGGGQLWITETTANQASGASIQADAGSAIVLRTAAVNSGRLGSTGSGLIVNTNNQTSSIDDVTLLAGSLLQLNDNSTLRIKNNLVNNGLVTIQNIGAPGNVTALTADTPSVSLTGSGTVRLQATSNFNDTAYLGATAPANILTNAATHTISGNGRIHAAMVNNGTVLADEPTANRQVLQLLGEPKTNNGTMRAMGTGQLWITETTVNQGPGGLIAAEPGSATILRSSTVTGGTLSSTGTGIIVNTNNQTSTLSGATLAPGSLLQINDNSILNIGSAGLTNNGSITIQNIGAPGNITRLVAPAAATISGAGTIRLQATSFSNDTSYFQGAGGPANPLTLGAGQIVSGSGRIYGDVISGGKITPDQPFGATSPIGIIEARSGALTMTPTSSLDIQLASAGSFDRITGNDTVACSGTLNVSFVTPYSPAPSAYFDIVTGASISGPFTATNLPPTGSTGPMHVVYFPTAARLVACYANCDGSNVAPILNVNDFTCFLNRFAAGDTYANCDGSTVPPILNVNDFTCFLNKFAAGCP